MAWCLLLAVAVAQGAELPAWWTALPRMPRLESDFIQESESAVFGKLKKGGTLKMSRGGRLRISYRQGILLVADGVDIIQYDPGTRTAQRLDFKSTARDAPLLNLLTDPSGIHAVYDISSPGSDQVRLTPRRKGLPEILAEGRGGLLKRLSWTDPTGARQVLELKAPRVPPGPFPASTFVFSAPAGTRWMNRRAGATAF